MIDVARYVLAPNPSALTGPGTNTYILGSGTSVAVIDPGPDIASHHDAILAALRPGQHVSHILVTHPHRDHSALAARLSAATGAPVLAFGIAGSGRSARMRRLAEQTEPGGGEGRDAGFIPDQRLAHGDIVAGDGWHLEVLHCPGHMAEHLCFAFGDVLFSGDHVMAWSSSLISPPDGDMGDYMASLALLARRPWQKFLPGHGDPVNAPAARLAELSAHRRAREAAILDVIAKGPATLAEITARVYADTPTSLHAAAARNAFAHLVDLVDKGRVAADPTLGPLAMFHRI